MSSGVISRNAVGLFGLVLYLPILLFGPFLYPGIINRVKAMWAGKRGLPLWQLLHDTVKLLRKGAVRSVTTSLVFPVAPAINLAAVTFASLLVAPPGLRAVISFDGDFVLFVYLLGLARFMMVLAALDTGSSFEGMGASREVTLATIVEPAYFALVGTLALATGHLSFQSIFDALGGNPLYTLAVRIVCTGAVFIMLITEGSRVPVDDPNTHLELTMIHEVMVLDYSGPDLAFIQYASGLKMVLLSTLGANLAVPLIPSAIPGPALTASLLIGGVYLGVLLLTAVAVGLVEALIARSRMSHVPQLVFLMTALSLTAFAVVTYFSRGGY